MDRAAARAMDHDSEGVETGLTLDQPPRNRRKPLRVIVPTQKRERSFWTAGATRIGTSSGLKILKEARGEAVSGEAAKY